MVCMQLLNRHKLERLGFFVIVIRSGMLDWTIQHHWCDAGLLCSPRNHTCPRVWIRKELGKTTVLCASCSFHQRDDRISAPGWVGRQPGGNFPYQSQPVESLQFQRAHPVFPGILTLQPPPTPKLQSRRKLGRPDRWVMTL